VQHTRPFASPLLENARLFRALTAASCSRTCHVNQGPARLLLVQRSEILTSQRCRPQGTSGAFEVAMQVKNKLSEKIEFFFKLKKIDNLRKSFM